MLKWINLATVHGVSALNALVVFMVLGYSLGSLLGALIVYLTSYAILKYWLGGEAPNPVLALLYILSLWGLIGGVQFIVFISVIIALFTLKALKIAENPLEGIIASLKMLIPASLAILAPVFAAYHAVRHLSRAVGISAMLLALVALMSFFPLFSIQKMNLYTYDPWGFLGLSAGNPLAWAGVIAYEEVSTRPIPLGNAFFSLLHYTSRLAIFYQAGFGDLFAAMLATTVILYISWGTLWLYDLYRRYGLAGSLAGHAVYNSAVTIGGSLLGLLLIPLFLLVGIAVYTATSKEQ